MRRMLKKQIIPENQIVTLRQYREYVQAIHGPETINDFMLRVMEAAAMGRPMTRLDWDKMQVGIKLKHAELTGR
ncbi:MAG: hypothetical protein ABFE07_29185 [Armatimonadia bacterium]